MKSCSWIKRVEAYTDGQTAGGEAIEAHLAECATCANHRDTILACRAAVRAEAPPLTDEQFPAFMEGIRTGISQEPPRYRGFWALTSLAAAAMVIAVATFSILNGGAPEPVSADGVESVSTEIDGATVEWGDSGGGVTTIWISISEDDI